MSFATDDRVQWATATPLWKKAADAVAEDPSGIRRPALLRFASDSFMEDLAKTLESSPAAIDQFRAKPESFRLGPPGPSDSKLPEPTRLKLYQATHGHFYLVAASLVCRMPGLPDHSVSSADDERVSFVLRRIAGTGASQVEMAWVQDPAAPKGKSWRPVAAGEVEEVSPGEELLPMFPLNFEMDDAPRRLFVGLVPTSSGESFRAAGAVDPFPARPGEPALDAAKLDPRPEEFATKVIEPYRALLATPPPPLSTAQKQEASAFILLDFADVLARYLPDLWKELQDLRPPPALSATYDLYHRLVTFWADDSQGLSWRDGMVKAWNEALEIAGESAGKPTLKCNLSFAETGADQVGPDDLANAVAEALKGAPAPVAVPMVPKLDPRSQATYRIRCVYQRPRCGPLRPDLVSGPTEDFTIAPFFDLDAPAREIRISLPIDVGMQDLRKFRKNVGFVISNQLKEQMNRITDLKQAVGGELNPVVSIDVGFLCSLSIPIITICALIVLMLFINLLNIVFFWLPFVTQCFPVGLKGRQS